MWLMPATSCLQNPRGSSPSSRTAWSTTSSIDENEPVRQPLLLQAQSHKARIAIRRHHQQDDRFLAILLELFDTLLEFSGVCNRLLLNFRNDHARREPFFGRRRIRINAGNQDALHFVLDIVLFAELVGEIGKIKTERALHWRLHVGRRLLFGIERGLLFILQSAEFD